MSTFISLSCPHNSNPLPRRGRGQGEGDVRHEFVKRHTIIIFTIFLILGLFAPSLYAEQAKSPKVIIQEGPPPDYSTTGEILVEYSNPEWMTDEEILALKVTSEYKHRHDWLAQASKGTRKLKKQDYQIIAFNPQTKEERIIFEGVPMKDFSYNDRQNIFAITTGMLVDYRDDLFREQKIVILDLAAKEIKSLGIAGDDLRLSPKGDMLLYSKYPSYPYSNMEETGTFVYFFDTGETQKLFSTATYLKVWDPNKDTVVYRTGKEKEHKTFRIDPVTKIEQLFEFPGYPKDWSRDGKSFYTGMIRYLDGTYLKLPIERLHGNHHRLSPSGDRLLFLSGSCPDAYGGAVRLYYVEEDKIDAILCSKREVKHKNRLLDIVL